MVSVNNCIAYHTLDHLSFSVFQTHCAVSAIHSDKQFVYISIQIQVFPNTTNRIPPFFAARKKTCENEYFAQKVYFVHRRDASSFVFRENKTLICVGGQEITDIFVNSTTVFFAGNVN